MGMLEGYIQDKDFKVLCLTETWLKEYESVNVSISALYPCSCYSRRVHIRGGCMILVRNDIPCKNLDRLVCTSIEKHFEISGIKILDLDIVILTIYRSPSGDIDVFVEKLDHALSFFPASQRVIVTGDFNVWFGTDRHDTCLVLECFNTFGFIPLIETATRGKNCIDNIFINFDSTCVEAVVSDQLSDHNSIAVRCTLNQESRLNKITCRPMTERGKFVFYESVSNIDWDFVSYNDLDIDKKFQMFLSAVLEGFEMAFPVKQVGEKQLGSSDNWFTPELCMLRNRLNVLNTIYKVMNTNEVKNMRNIVHAQYNKKIKVAKIEYNDRLIKESQCSGKIMWQIINQNRPNTLNKIKAEFDPNEVNDFFLNVPVDIINNLNNSHLENKFTYFLNKIDAKHCSFSFGKASFIEVRDIIDSLKPKSTKDIYGLSVKLIKQVKNLIIEPLTKLINFAICEGVFPNALKTGLIVPVFKKGSPDQLENFRPISLLPVFSKIFERVLSSRIADYFEGNSLFAATQYGFRKGKCTSEAIADFVERTVECFEQGQYLVGSFCDLSKAFDCVQHDLLIEKLNKYNFDNLSLKLIKSYLTGRTQTVKCGNSFSEKKLITVGVPQGSILGPLLFLIYINDLAQNISQSDVIMYADDTTIINFGNNHEMTQSKAHTALNNAEMWFTSNKLKLNTEKTTVTAFSMRSTLNSDCVKFLGVYLDPKLTWDKHIQYVFNKLSSSIYLLRLLSNNVSKQVLKCAYFSLCQSIMTYALLVWGGASSCDRIFRLQRRAIRILDNLKYRDDCRNSFIKQKILTFPGLYILECVIYVRQNLHKCVTHDSVHGYETRNGAHLIPNFCRLTRSQRHFNFVAIKFFNKIPAEVTRLSHRLFKLKMKSFLIQRAYYSCLEYLDDVVNVGDFEPVIKIN